MSVTFKTCPICNGYGVLDCGKNCTECGGVGEGGLTTMRAGIPGNYIGSGEIMFDSETGQRISYREFMERHTGKAL
jgi:DnaJ-class molecular chaperone